jgi:hypothetical protein
MLGVVSRWRARRRALRAVSLRVEAEARRLRGLPPLPAAARVDPSMVILRSAAELLADVPTPPAAAADPAFEAPGPLASPVLAEWEARAAVSVDPSDLHPSWLADDAYPARPMDSTPDVAADGVAAPAAPADDRVPATAERLIKLRDWILLSRAQGDEGAPRVLDGLYRELGKVLEREGVEPLEADGPFDDQRQQVIQTEPTDDPARHDRVCATVRPGYLFHGRLLRPQEVTVYAYAAPAGTPGTP